MKLLKKVRLMLIAIVIMFSPVLLVACGMNTNFELVSIALSNSEYNRTWAYVNNELSENIVVNRAGPQYVMDVVMKDSKGKTVTYKTYSFWEGEETVTVPINGTNYSSVFLHIDIQGYDDSVVDNIPVTITLSGGNGSTITGSASAQVNVDIVHALKSAELVKENNFSNYQKNEPFNGVAGVYLDCVYEDDSTERLPFSEVLTMPQYSDAYIGEASTSKVGLHQSVSIRYPTSSSGTTTTLVYYDVLPDQNIWSLNDSLQYNSWIHKDMQVDNVSYKGQAFRHITVPGTNISIKMTYDTGYFIINPNDSTFYWAMSNTSNRALNALIPTGHRPNIVGSARYENYYRINYNLITDDMEWVSRNVMYLFSIGNGNEIIAVTIENHEELSLNEQYIVDEFISLIWFK